MSSYVSCICVSFYVEKNEANNDSGCMLSTSTLEQGMYHNLLQELCYRDPESHFRYI